MYDVRCTIWDVRFGMYDLQFYTERWLLKVGERSRTPEANRSVTMYNLKLGFAIWNFLVFMIYIPHPTSHIQHPPSDIHHPTSHIIHLLHPLHQHPQPLPMLSARSAAAHGPWPGKDLSARASGQKDQFAVRRLLNS
jgi:hypothetical protein